MKVREIYYKHRLWVVMLFLLLILTVAFLLLYYLTPLPKIFSEPESIKAFVLSYESWAVLVYVLLSILIVVSPPLPNEIVTISGGIIFGFWTALIFGLIARVIGSTINYWLGTKIRKGIYVKLISQEEQEKLKKYTEKFGWQTAFLCRWLPSMDTDLIAYMAGIAKMKYSTFIIASFFGMFIPVSFTIWIGASVFTNKYLFLSLVAFYILGILFIPKIIKRLFKDKIPSQL